MPRSPGGLIKPPIPDQPQGVAAMVVIAAMYAPGTIADRAMLIAAVTPILAIMLRAARP